MRAELRKTVSGSPSSDVASISSLAATCRMTTPYASASASNSQSSHVRRTRSISVLRLAGWSHRSPASPLSPLSPGTLPAAGASAILGLSACVLLLGAKMVRASRS
jgi:hypothetical protein